VAPGEHIARQVEAARLRPFLERRLRVHGRRALSGEHRLVGAADEGAGRAEPRVEEERAEHRLERVGKHRRPALDARFGLVGRDVDHLGELRRFRDPGEHGLGDEGGEPAPQRALALAREALGEPFGDQEPEHAVAHEFEPFVRALAARGGAMGQCLAEQLGPREAVAEQALCRIHACRRLRLDRFAHRRRLFARAGRARRGR
jgi:hypothetical protein